MKKKILFAVPVLLIIVAAVCVIALAVSGPPDGQEAITSFEEILTADGCFEFSCALETDGEMREYFWFTGERSGDKRHLSGRVLGSPLELYYGEGRIYRYDQADAAWQTYEVEDLAEAAALYSELEPAGTFAHKEFIEINYLGKTETAQGKLHSFQAIPVADGWVADFFTDITYTLFTNKAGQVKAAALSGVMINDPDTTLDAMLLIKEGKTGNIDLPQIGE